MIAAAWNTSDAKPPRSTTWRRRVSAGEILVASSRAKHDAALAMTNNHDLTQKEMQEAAKITPFELPPLPGEAVPTQTAALDALGDVELDVRIELGRAYMHLEDATNLPCGAVVPLDRPADGPVDVFAGDRLIARGELLVLDNKYCVRVTELVAAAAG
jgi:flagellar motor switch protein FliN